ncbi:MAG: hypothetical protein ACD_7C00492G0006 [uncultured bacterium]|nr:MAG: hypothetical protein ACD_7C00492G0006 [uncultured bacterium]HBR79339.1 hypothetical protein [Candidatus Moranbacteria bacterium]
MHLSENDIHLFYKLHPALLFYVNKRLGILTDNIKTPDELRQINVEKILKVRNKLFENIQLIDDFAKENPFGFSQEELEIVSSWKQYVRGKFFIIKYLKNYAVFLNDKKPPKAYGVKALVSSFEDTIGDYFPIMVDAILLPFKKCLTYDGFLLSKNISFGRGIRLDLNEEFKIAEAQFGIIESLSGIEQPKQDTDEEKLRRYLKTDASRQHFSKEIFELIRKNHKLEIIYHQEGGKKYVRSYKKDLRDIGILNGWFGILQGILIVSGSTEEDVAKTIKKIVPLKRQDLVFIFQIKNGK